MKFDLDQDQRDFAASIDAALGAADVPGAVRAWSAGDAEPGRAVWSRLTELGVTALAVPEEFDGIGAHPVDVVLAIEALGRWCVPGPVVESIAVAPILLAGAPDAADRLAGLAAGELIATVALPPHTPRAVDADRAGLVLHAEAGRAATAQVGTRHASVDPSRGVFDVAAGDDAWDADTVRAYEMGALATAAQLIGAGQAMLDIAVDYAKQRTQFGRVIGATRRSSTSWPMCTSRSSWPARWCTARHCPMRTVPPTPPGMSVRPRWPPPMRPCWPPIPRCRPTVPSASPANATCRCGCCGCRRCARPGVTRPPTVGECWR